MYNYKSPGIKTFPFKIRLLHHLFLAMTAYCLLPNSFTF